MGQQNSTKNSGKTLEEEFQYISQQTGLQEDELKSIYETFSKKGNLNKEEFKSTYRKFYPK